MPRATSRYSFEFKVLAWAGDLAARLAAPGSKGAFLLILNAAGSTVALSFAAPSSGWLEEIRAMEAAGIPHLFYDPFDAPEYTWISWSQIEQPTMERIMGIGFAPVDFVTEARPPAHGPEPSRSSRFPTTWGVLF